MTQVAEGRGARVVYIITDKVVHLSAVRGVRARPGSALLELLVAMPLALLVAGLAVQLFVTQLRVTARVEGKLHNQRELEHAAMVLASELRGASANSLESWTDSSLVLRNAVAVGIVCATPAPHVVDIIVGDASDPLRAALFAAPRAGDVLAAPTADTSNAGAPLAELDSSSRYATVTHAQTVSSACSASPLRRSASASPWRLTIVPLASGSVAIGELVTVARRTEWRAYRAADGEYYLGKREWNGSVWSITQPAIGPLLPNVQAGFRLSVARANGTPVNTADPDARMLQLTFRMPRRPHNVATPYDSLLVQLALRGGR